MTSQMKPFAFGTFVWLKLLNGVWWPGQIVDPKQISEKFKDNSNKIKNAFAIVYFERENNYKIINVDDEVCLYSCTRKMEFLKSGYDLSINQSLIPQKEFDASHFVEDILRIEKEIGGNLNIFEELRNTIKSTFSAEHPFLFNCGVSGCGFKTNKYDFLRQHKNSMHSLFENYGTNFEESIRHHEPRVQNMIIDYLREIEKHRTENQ